MLAELEAYLRRTACSGITVAGCALGQLGAGSLVTLDNLTVSYRQHPALHHICGTFKAGSLTAVVGPNGAGKSTLLKSIVGLLPFGGGTVSAATPAQRIAYLPQMAEIDRHFPINVHDCIALGFWNAAGAWNPIGIPLQQRIGMALKAVGLEGFEKRTVGTLSTGQLQRVMFARLLVQDADLILLDEPFNAVDSRTTAELLRLVKHWHEQGRTIIAVVHDDQQVREFFPETLLLARQVVAWGATAEVFTPEHIEHARQMSEAWDETAEFCHVDLHAAEKASA